MIRTPMKNVIEVQKKEIYNSDGTYRASIDSPKEHETSKQYSFLISGWILGEKKPITHVEIRRNKITLSKIPVRLKRNDILSSIEWIDKSREDHLAAGFQGEFGVIGLPEIAILDIEGVFEDGKRILFGRITIKHSKIQPRYKSILNPVILVSMGRTGTSIIMKTLAKHPKLISYQKHPTLENFSAQYWLHMVRVLSQPANQFYSTPAYNFDKNNFNIGPSPYNQRFIYPFGVETEDSVKEWFGQEYVQSLADFSKRMIDQYYLRVAMCQNLNKKWGKPKIKYFLEKHMLNQSKDLLFELYPNTKEILSVRDFRDVICSIYAYNKKNKSNSFGVDRVKDIKEYVRVIAKDFAYSMMNRLNENFDKILVVRYEDFLIDMEKELERIFVYLNIPLSKKDIKKIIDSYDKDSTKSKKHMTSVSAVKSIQRWRTELSPEVITLCNEELKEPLEVFGYSVKN